MNSANRKSKLSRYAVVLKREVEFTRTVDVEARNAEEAQDVAINLIESADVNFWGTGVVTTTSAKAKVIR